jgi:CheY-like chemotaxis protein
MTSHTILLVEDNADDVFFMERAVKKSGLAAPLQVVRDGQQAIDYLSGTGAYGDRGVHPLPSVVFLDLKLPYVHGFDVLEWIRQTSSLKHLPVAVLTSSAEERDRKRAEQLGAQAYLVKPADADMLLQVVGSLTYQAKG